MEPLNLLSFPEELLEKILAHCVVAHTPHPPRPSWHNSSATSPPVRGRLALLLVSKTFLRIATPLFYHTLHVASPSQLHCLLRDALRPNAALAAHIRRVVLAGIWAEGGELLQLCHARLETLDIILDTMPVAPGVHGDVRDLDAEEFCAALADLTALTHLVVRKPCNVYLTQPRPRYVLAALAEAMHAWNELEHADLAFRVADDAAGRGAPGPMAALTRALATRPKLHTLATMLPNVWNEAMLRVSANPALERIVLADGVGAGPEQARGVTWAGARAFYAAPVAAALSAPVSASEGVQAASIQCTGLFFAQAKKHTRLCELIRAGTFIMRTRAKTMAPPGGAQRAYPYARSQSVVPVAELASKERAPLAAERLEASTSSRPRSSTYASPPRGTTACAASSSR